MREEYNIGELNPRKNPYIKCDNIEHLTSLINDAIIDARFTAEKLKPARIAAYLIQNGVQLHGNPNTISLPCPVGTTLYRIDSRERACSYHHNHRSNMYYCVNDYRCKHLCDGLCDDRFEYEIYTIENASAMAILGNAPYFGTRVFTDKEEAEKELEKKRAEEIERMRRAALDLSASYEGYREHWEDECEEDDE